MSGQATPIGVPATCTYRYLQQTVAISGHNVLVEYYRPNGRGPFPLVFMLHGSTGAFSVEADLDAAEETDGVVDRVGGGGMNLLAKLDGVGVGPGWGGEGGE
jgi:poly(3-hydroxybutyrate) depolymerase